VSGLTPEQKARRRFGIGASEIAALLGISKWSSPIALWEAKVLGHEIDESYAMELGTEMESPIAKIWARKAKRYIALVDTIQHPKLRFAIATPDRGVFLTKEDMGDGRRKKQRPDLERAEKILQVKSTNWRMAHLWGEEDTDSIPDEYVAASHWEGTVAGVQIVDFAVDFDKTKLKTYRVMVDEEIFAGMYEVAERFMIDHVLARVPPAPDATDRYSEYLKRAFPRETSANLDLVQNTEEDVLQTIALFAKLKTAEKRLEAIMTLAKNKIVARIGGATGITGTFGKITYKKTKDGSKVNWQAVADESMRIAALVVQAMPEGGTRAELAEDLKKLIAANTTPKVGYRRLNLTLAGDLKYEARDIDLRLEAISKGLAEEPVAQDSDDASSTAATGE
jgi:putative phage-type endonuclease